MSLTGSALCILHGRMKTRIVYSRDFLLSFGELEHCKKLPPGFDTALLRSLCLAFCWLGLLPSVAKWDFCLTIFAVASPTVSCRSCQRACLRETRATTIHPRDGQTGRGEDILTLLVVGTLEGGGTLAHLDQAIGMGSYPIASLRHRVKLLFCPRNFFALEITFLKLAVYDLSV